MIAPIIDRDAIIEKAARIIAINSGPLGTHYLDHAQNAARAALPSIADDLLAPIEALHSGKHWCGTDHGDYDWYRPEKAESCPTAQAVAAIREAVRA